MVKIKKLFSTYIWLLDTIYRLGPISLKNINQRWVLSEQSGGNPFPRSTFYKLLDAIEDTFGVNITCDFRDNTYSIEDTRALTQNTLSRWMLSTMSVAGVVRESRSLQNRIVLEAVPSGDMLLTEITRAMENSVTMKIRYRKFVDVQSYEAEVEPYCLKLFHQRWYLLAHRVDRDYLAIYALDRMETASQTNTPFVLPSDFDAQQHFSHLFGVFQPGDNDKLELVRLRTYDGEWNYLKSLPMHESQREVKRTDKYVDFAFNLYPTLDFKLEILSRGANIEVMEPASLRQSISEMAQAAAARYRCDHT